MALISQGKSVEENSNNTTRNEAEDVRNICCSFRQYLDCSEHAAQRICGEKTGKFIRGFLDRMGNSLIKMYCADYHLGSEKCYGYSKASCLSCRFVNFLLMLSISLMYFLR